MLNCKLGGFPFIYLGLPISDRKLTIEQWNFLVNKLAGKVEVWMGRLLSSGGRLILSNACLDALPTYAMGLFFLQDGIHDKFDTIRARFYWEGSGPKRKYHMVNWPAVCRPKECGGLGLTNTKNMNKALMIKWIWKLFAGESSLWYRLIRAKYPEANNIFATTPQGGSQFWRSLHKIKHLFKLGARFVVSNGARTLFWLDWWFGTGPLSLRFPRLFAICENQQLLVSTAFEVDGVRFRRSFDPACAEEWETLTTELAEVQLQQGEDTVRWALEPSGRFSVASMYHKLSQGVPVAHSADLWAANLPLKIKIFLWQLILDRLPASKQVAAKMGPSDGRCVLCGAIEDATHIFFSCFLANVGWSVLRQLLGCSWAPANFPQFFAIQQSLLGRQRRISWVLFAALCWALWTTRNKLTIDAVLPKHPSDVIFKMSMFIQVWANLAKEQDKEALLLMTNGLKEIYRAITPGSSQGSSQV